MVSCQISSSDPYVRKEMKRRAQKDSFLKFHKESPFAPMNQVSFFSLNYFEPSREYLVKGKLVPTQGNSTIMMEYTKGDQNLYKEVGVINFTLRGKQCSLKAYQNKEMALSPDHQYELFVPFWDETNGNGSYHGGRFMDLNYAVDKDSVVVDFNQCYNPYCAYMNTFSCPIPPAQNKIPFKVEAGEKNYKDN
jgi:uncharacterized protein (DUF1684 family)